jgi:hypothetical protein
MCAMRWQSIATVLSTAMRRSKSLSTGFGPSVYARFPKCLFEAPHITTVAVVELGPVRTKPAGDWVERAVDDPSSNGDGGLAALCNRESDRRCRRAACHCEHHRYQGTVSPPRGLDHVAKLGEAQPEPHTRTCRCCYACGWRTSPLAAEEKHQPLTLVVDFTSLRL